MPELQKMSCPKCGAIFSALAANAGDSATCAACGETLIVSLSAAPPVGSVPLDETEKELADLAVLLRYFAPEDRVRATAFPRHATECPGARFLTAELLTKEQLAHMMDVLAFKEKRVEDHGFGVLAIERGWASPEDIAAAMAQQKQRFLKENRTVRIDALLLEKGVLTQEQCGTLLARQSHTASQATNPTPPVSNLRLVIAEDCMSAAVAFDENAPPTLEQLRALLAERGVVHGVDEARLSALARGKIAAGDTPVVASGTPSLPPRDGAVEYLFDIHPLKAASERGEGHVDFRDRGEIPQVDAGTVIARRTPPIPGTPGTDVLGRTRPAANAKDMPLRVGKGAELDADKLAVLATVDGHPALSATGVISVYPEYTIKGDLDYSTGHVDFHGRVVVAGTIRSGFRVRCGELVAQEIETAQVDSEGDVTVSGGIIGARIRSGGTLRARYIHQARAEVLGDVIIARELVDSQLQIGGAFDGKQCVIYSSHVSAMGGLEARQIGSESSSPCRIVVGVDERVQQEIAQRQQQIEALAAACAEVERRIAEATANREAITTLIGPLAQEQDRALVRERELRQSGGATTQAEVEKLNLVAHTAEGKLDALFAEQERLQAQTDADAALLAEKRADIEAQEAELAHIKSWAAERVGQFVVRAQLVRQQTALKGPHVEVRLTADTKAPKLIEREHADQAGHSVWLIINE